MVTRISLSIRQWIFLTLGVLLVLYILFQARFLILGPQISITYPTDATEVSESVLTMTGRATNVAGLTLNGRKIYTDEKGYWSEKLLLSPGPSIMTLTGRDRFGREDTEQVRVIFINHSSTASSTSSE